MADNTPQGIRPPASAFPPVVDAAWLAAHRASVVVVDARGGRAGRSGEEGYRQGHIPGAVFVDMERWLSGPPSAAAGRHPLPDPAVFALGMGRAGIGDGATVVGYDDVGGVLAARCVWMLRALGEAAALLDGGLAAWTGPLETGEARPAPARFQTRPWPREALATIDEVARAVAGPGPLVLDARSRERYRGEGEAVDARGGHIPGSITAPCRENLDHAGRFLAPEALRSRFAALGVEDARDVISSCGSGVTACHNLLALEWVGLGRGRLFPGSWSQWSGDPSRPVATGEGRG